jgi:hypothetical protein
MGTLVADVESSALPTPLTLLVHAILVLGYVSTAQELVTFLKKKKKLLNSFLHIFIPIPYLTA